MAHTTGSSPSGPGAHKSTFHKIKSEAFGATFMSLREATFATQERSRRCETRWPGLSVATFSTATHRRQRAFVGFRGVKAPCGGSTLLPAFQVWRPQGRGPDRASVSLGCPPYPAGEVSRHPACLLRAAWLLSPTPINCHPGRREKRRKGQSEAPAASCRQPSSRYSCHPAAGHKCDHRQEAFEEDA